MNSLPDFVPQLQRFVAVPGTFEQLFPATSEDDLVGALADGLSDAQLSGFFSTHTLDLTTFTVTPDLVPGQGSLVVLFAGVRMLQAEIRNRKSHARYEAGSVVSETDYSSQVLTELLKEYQAEKKNLIAAVSRVGASDTFIFADMYYVRATNDYVPTVSSQVSHHHPFGGLGQAGT